MMTTVHVAKWNCFKLSRPLMERRWDPGKVVFVALAEPGWEEIAKSWDVEYEPLAFSAVWRWALRPDTRMVFHGQPSLPYLFCATMARSLTGRGAEFLYDIHDLHEKATKGVRGIRRWVLFGFLEWVCLRLKKIRSITVSPGLAKEVARRYGCREPSQCFSIPLQERPLTLPAWNSRHGIVYFGIIENYRLSEDRLSAMAREGLSIDVYGRLVQQCRPAFELLNRFEALKVVRLRGEYCPDSLEFLDQYEAVLMDYGTSRSANVRHCLPNKLFQSLRHGLTVLVSANLEDAIDVFSSIPGAVMPLTSDSTICEVIQRARAMRPVDYCERINRRLDQLHAESRLAYLGTKPGDQVRM